MSEKAKTQEVDEELNVDYYPIHLAVVQEEGKVEAVLLAIKTGEGKKTNVIYKPIWAKDKFEDLECLFKDLIEIIKDKYSKKK